MIGCAMTVQLRCMISERQLEEWRAQSLKDAEAFRQDEKQLQELGPGKSQLRTLFERVRGRYLNFQSEENNKLSRLLSYTEMDREMEHYPALVRIYLTYNTASIFLFAACALAPKKLFSKIIISLVVYGLKTNIADGLLTYHMVETMALSTRMTPQEQELRNVVEFYYLHRFFKGTLLNEEEKRQAADLIAKIQALNDTYRKFTQLHQLL